MRNLARALYPATLVEDATLTATAAALEHGALSQALRLVVQEQEAILRSVLAGRSVVPRYSWLLVVTRRGRRRRRERRRNRA
jgi:hypothetical protein